MTKSPSDVDVLDALHQVGAEMLLEMLVDEGEYKYRKSIGEELKKRCEALAASRNGTLKGGCNE